MNGPEPRRHQGTAELVELGDVDELTRHVDRLCDARDWEGLVELRHRCRAALARGKQLWPVAAHAEYRLALEAPGRWAALTLEPGSGHFALGPLPEVAASTHAWAELAPHLPAGPLAGLVAHERVIRGEDLTIDPLLATLPPVLELPLRLQPWEPAYPLAEYRAHQAFFPSAVASRLGPPVALAGHPSSEPIEDPEGCRALVELAATWVAESNGRAEAVAVTGEATDAVAALGLVRARLARVTAADALAAMSWTAASGGAHGRRRGMAPGRFAAWWAIAAVAGMLDRWPVAPDELGRAAERLRWWRWDAGEPETGWSLHLAVHDPDDGLAWALTASDAALA